MNLYQLSAQYQHDAAKLADLDLDDQTLADTLESMSGDLEVKATNTIMVARNLGATSQAIKDAAAAMLERARAIDNRVDTLKKRVFTTMLATNIERIESPYFALSIANNPPSVDIYDERSIPADFMVTPEPLPAKPDKKAIGTALKVGHEIPGARLTQGQRLVIK